MGGGCRARQGIPTAGTHKWKENSKTFSLAPILVAHEYSANSINKHRVFVVPFHFLTFVLFTPFLLFSARLCALNPMQTHLICTVPPYIEADIMEPVTVQMLVTSSNKYSEPHSFVYTPKNAFGADAIMPAATLSTLQQTVVKNVQGILWVFI